MTDRLQSRKRRWTTHDYVAGAVLLAMAALLVGIILSSGLSVLGEVQDYFERLVSDPIGTMRSSFSGRDALAECWIEALAGVCLMLVVLGVPWVLFKQHRRAITRAYFILILALMVLAVVALVLNFKSGPEPPSPPRTEFTA